jgi:hypothetical protein
LISSVLPRENSATKATTSRSFLRVAALSASRSVRSASMPCCRSSQSARSVMAVASRMRRAL